MLLVETIADDYYTEQSHIVIYELDKVLAGENSTPRKISLGDVRFSRLLVDKTSVTVASDCGSVVKFDFWGCE